MTTVVISQPMYLPWPGFVSQLALADVLIWLDDAQFSRGSFTNRVQIRTAFGDKWLSIPLIGKGFGVQIVGLQAAQPAWARSHHELARQALNGTPFLPDALSILAAISGPASLCDTLIASSELCLSACGKPCPTTQRSSEMDVTGRSWRRVLDLVHAVGGTRYLTGHGAANYLDHAAFEAEGVTIDYMGYDFAPWPQAHGAFSPYVTSLELIAHVAPQDRQRHLSTKTIPWRDFLTSKGLPVNG